MYNTQLIKDFEGLRLYPYDDQTGKKITSYVKGATIGYGHLIKKDDWHKYKNGISKETASILLQQDLLRFDYAVDSNTIPNTLKTHQKDALTSLAYNIGVTAFSRSSVVKILNGRKSKYKSLKSAWLAWNKSQGKVMKGLVNRRNKEWEYYNNGDS